MVATRPVGGEEAPSSDLLAVVTSFCRALRARGVVATPAETIDAARALATVDVGDRLEVYLALRSVLVTRVEDFMVFDELFDAMWAGGQAGGRTEGPNGVTPPSSVVAPPSGGQKPQRAAVSLDRWMRPGDNESGPPVGVPAPSERELLGDKDFSTFSTEELTEITRLAARIARRLASSPSRRWRPASHGPRIDMRRTVRQSLKTGGEEVELDYRERKPRKTKLVALCDI